MGAIGRTDGEFSEGGGGRLRHGKGKLMVMEADAQGAPGGYSVEGSWDQDQVQGTARIQYASGATYEVRQED